MENESKENEIMKEVRREFAEAKEWGIKEGWGISALKFFLAGSEETNCFVSKVTKQGVIVGDARNDGKGGPTFINVKEKLAPAEYGKLEHFVDQLVEDAIADRERKRILKRVQNSEKRKGAALLAFKWDGDSLGYVSTRNPDMAALFIYLNDPKYSGYEIVRL